jgi:zinc transport system substrate-binding protein
MRHMPSPRALARLSLAVVGLLALTACSGTSGDGAGAAPAGSSGSVPAGPITVVTSFYPLEYLVERVGGSAVEVTNLAALGAEPHDLELTPKDVARIAEADQVVYLSGFQPAVDDAVAAQAADTSWDVAAAADLSLTYTPIEEGSTATDEAGSTDPHFWLDPTRYAQVAEALADEFSALSPPDAEDFAANAAAVTAELTALDAEWSAATGTCVSRDLVTSHNAFGYLAERYGFVQRGITGLTPEDEPSPQALAATADFVRANDVAIIYYETLVSPAIAQTVAAETGASTAVLDPIEGLSAESAGTDYFAIMRTNLATVVAGQSCG